MCNPDEGVTYDLQYRRDRPMKKKARTVVQKMGRKTKPKGRKRAGK